jgi:putative serine protease PepD
MPADVTPPGNGRAVLTVPRSWTAWFAVGGLATVLVSAAVGGFSGYLAGESRQLADLSAAAPQGANDPQFVPIVVRGTDQIAAVAAKSTSAVAKLTVSKKTGTGTAVGSAFVIREDGYLVTNARVTHALEGGGTLTVTFPDGSHYPGTLVGTSPAYDLAVVKVDQTGLPTLAWGDAKKVQPGQEIVAIGSTLGKSGTVTSGVVSAIDRPITIGPNVELSFLNAIQTDAAVTIGNSGGPLVNMDGTVIGVNLALADDGSGTQTEAGPNGAGFAVPSTVAKRVASNLIADGTSPVPVMGVEIDAPAAGPGALITRVVPGSAAATADLKRGDIILKVDGAATNDAMSVIVKIREHAVGDRAVLTITREGTTMTVPVTLTAAKN